MYYILYTIYCMACFIWKIEPIFRFGLRAVCAALLSHLRVAFFSDTFCGKMNIDGQVILHRNLLYTTSYYIHIYSVGTGVDAIFSLVRKTVFDIVFVLCTILRPLHINVGKWKLQQYNKWMIVRNSLYRPWNFYWKFWGLWKWFVYSNMQSNLKVCCNCS